MISRPALFKHACLLRHAGFTKVTKTGHERIYELVPKGGGTIRRLITELEGIRGFWEVAPAAFKYHPGGKGE